LQHIPASLMRSVTPYFTVLRVPARPNAFLDSAGSLEATLGATPHSEKVLAPRPRKSCPQMPLTDVQIRSLNGGQKPVKPSKEKSGQPKVSKPKNTTKGAGATLAKTDDSPSSS
jgi:hypothetical protein